LSLINKTTEEKEFIANVDKAVTLIEEAIERNRNNKIKEIRAAVKRIAKKSGKKRAKSSGVDKDTNQFFQDANNVLTQVVEGKRVERRFPKIESLEDVYASVRDKLINELAAEGVLPTVEQGFEEDGKTPKTVFSQSKLDELLIKEANGEKLTLKEQSYINTMVAVEMFSGLGDMSFQEVSQLLEDINISKSQGIKNLKKKMELQAKKRAAIKEQADSQISSIYKALYNYYSAKIKRNKDGDIEIEITINRKKEKYTVDKFKEKKNLNDFEKDVKEALEEYQEEGNEDTVTLKDTVLKDNNERVQDRRQIWDSFKEANV
jgi:hypothetical protein